MFTGKGGVGKTTLAAATAALLARAGRKVLVVSTDPAHSLGDALAVELSGEPLELEPGLFAAHIDTRALLDGSWTSLRGHLRTLLAGAGVDELVADELDKAPDPVFDKRVYEASAKKLLAVVRDLPDGAGPAVLVGHNPGVADLIELLTGKSPEMKTSAIAVLNVPGSWADVRPGGAELVEHVTPRG